MRSNQNLHRPSITCRRERLNINRVIGCKYSSRIDILGIVAYKKDICLQSAEQLNRKHDSEGRRFGPDFVYYEVLDYCYLSFPIC